MIKLNFLIKEHNLKEKINNIIMKKYYFEDIEIGFFKFEKSISLAEFKNLIKLLLKHEKNVVVEKIKEEELIKEAKNYDVYRSTLINKALISLYFETENDKILDFIIKYNSIETSKDLKEAIENFKDINSNQNISDDDYLFILLNFMLKSYLNLNFKSVEEFYKIKNLNENN